MREKYITHVQSHCTCWWCFHCRCRRGLLKLSYKKSVRVISYVSPWQSFMSCPCDFLSVVHRPSWPILWIWRVQVWASFLGKIYFRNELFSIQGKVYRRQLKLTSLGGAGEISRRITRSAKENPIHRDGGYFLSTGGGIATTPLILQNPISLVRTDWSCH